MNGIGNVILLFDLQHYVWRERQGGGSLVSGRFFMNFRYMLLLRDKYLVMTKLIFRYNEI